MVYNDKTLHSTMRYPMVIPFPSIRLYLQLKQRNALNTMRAHPI